MISFTQRIRDQENVKRIIAYLVLMWGVLGITLQIGRSFLGSNPLEFTLITFLYFTTQSNIIITCIAFFYLFTKKRGRLYTSFAFIGFLNILVTGIVFHTLLIPYMSGVSFLNHILHTINPILYAIFYMLVIEEHISSKKFYISLIYPLVYMLFVYVVIEPLLGDMLETLMPNFVGARFIYPFLDPRTYPSGISDLLIFNLGILAPSIALMSFILSYLKQRFEARMSRFNHEKETHS